MDFKFAKSNVRHARNNLAASYFVAMIFIVGLFGRFSTNPTTAFFILLTLAVGIATGLWLSRMRRVRSAAKRLVETSISMTPQGLTFRSPTELDNVPHATLDLRFVDVAAFRVDAPHGLKTVILKFKKGSFFILPPLQDLSGFVQELRRYLPQEKRAGLFGLRGEWRVT